jgi:hypothetical protein
VASAVDAFERDLVERIILTIDRFESLIDPHKKDLTSRFMQFAEIFFTDKKCDP